MSYPEKLSVVIPVFNEEDRVGKALKICQKFAKKYPGWEFILVNDGSTDKTAEIIKKNSSFKLISYAENRGKGYALKRGIAKATKPLVLICDVDFSTPLSEVNLLYPFIKKGAEVVIGSRRAQGAKVLIHQPFWREWLGQQFTNLSKLWLGLKVSDVTCGFKLFKKKEAKQLFKLSQIKRWGYDAEILFLAKKLGYQVVDVAVSWKNDEKTKVSMGKDIVISFIDLMLIRWYNLTNQY
jgi:glycosyltransferase involved in cell wall biosynthesis